MRLRLCAILMRRVARPLLARTRTPEDAARDFDRLSRCLFRPPPFARDLPRPLGGVPCHWITAGPVALRRVVLWLHGGAYLSGSGATHMAMLARLSRLSGLEIAAPDYRLLQEAPFPAAFEDALAAWEGLRALGYRAEDIALGGDSAGGGLALALLAHLLGRGERPAALVALSPWCDLTLSGESLRSLGPADALIPVGRMPEVVGRYLCGADPRDPRASPLFGRFAGAPPVLIEVGDAEALRSDGERMAARLREDGAPVTFRLAAGAPHVLPILDGWVPEARASLQEAARFLQDAFAKASR
nr:alpha/beta hydrolase fold domain-containing protein [Rubellimicrobium sp. CFH 75288]